MQLDPGRSLDLGELTFKVETVADDNSARLPREFVGRALLRIDVEQASERWALAYSFKVIPYTELCPGPVEMEETWRLPVQVVARGVETLELTPRWERTAGGVVKEETWEAKEQGYEVSLEASVPIQGSRLVCRLRYGFHGQLPRDFEPGFAIDFECPLQGPIGFLLDASAQPKAVRPLGAATALRVGDLVMHSLVLADGGSTDGARFHLSLGDTRRPMSSGEIALAHVRQEIHTLCRQRGRVTAFLEAPGEPRCALFTVLADEAAIDPTEQPCRPGPRLQELALGEHDDVDLRSVAQAVTESLVCSPAEHSPWEKSWPVIARLRLRDFAAWEPSREIVDAYQELTSPTRLALPWLWKSWGLHPERAQMDLAKYPLISRLVERLETLGRSQGFAFLPALLVGAQDFGLDRIPRHGCARMRYLIAMLCTGCHSSMTYRALSTNSIPTGPRLPGRENVNAPWWVSKPQDLKYPLAWELFRVGPGERDLRTLKLCRNVQIDDRRSEHREDAGEAAPDLTYSVIDLEQHLFEIKHPARWVVRAALACSQEWARYVVRGDDFAALAPILDAFHLVCKWTPVLTRALCIDAVLHEMDRHEVGWPAWDACRNDGQRDLRAFPELWKHLRVAQVN
ncbi:MAG: hypothetical protein HY699_05410 [Deltaproteobacteria bacterium]|nr:hypothetical protein [Deltaproteobacteria bacterium]